MEAIWLDISVIFSVLWNSEEVGSNAIEGMSLSMKASRQKKSKSFLLPSPLCRQPASGVTRLHKGGSSVVI